jgi:tRNA(adenine34) deaminase
MTPAPSNPVSPDEQAIDERFMRQAIAQAELARAIDEVPIGCVVVDNATNEVIAAAHNLRQTERDPTAHAEILALRAAAAKLGRWQLTGCTLYVTLEPCPMCAGALVNARIPRLVYGCADPKAGAVRTLFTLCEDPRLNHRVEVQPGVLAEESANLLRSFFQHQRSLGKK